MKTIIILAAAALLTGCKLGAPAAHHLIDATRPTGIHGRVFVQSTPYEGELLTVTDSALVLAAGKVISISRAIVTRVEFRPYMREDLGSLTRQQWETLRYGSRFPYGIPPDALASLLLRYSQNTVQVVP